MSARTWTVDVDGKKHNITVDCDSQSRRATIRVDGRIAAKPMGADESEREVPVGSIRYVIRRGENDTFDLDVPPEVFLNRATAASSKQAKQGKSVIGRGIAVAVVALIVLALLRYGRQGYQYMRVPWQPFAAPDASFKAKFPAQPTEQEQSENINGDIWTVKSFYSQYKNHFYAVEYVDLKMVVVEETTDSVITRFLEGWAGAIGGTVQSKEKTSLLRNPAFSFVIAIPAGAGPSEKKLPISARLRGVLALRERRLFIVWTLAALADPFSTDLRQFIDAFEIAPPSAQVATLKVSVPEPARQSPAAVSPPPEKRAEDSAVTEARLAQETAARRAAEPQIYLEPQWKMYHVAGCKAVTAEMKRVSVEERPFGYIPHLCVPEDVRNWTRKLR